MDSRLGVTNYRKEALVAAKKRSVKLSLKQASVIAESDATARCVDANVHPGDSSFCEG
jgi:hypothetical protein